MTVLHFIKRKQPLKLFKVSESLNSKHCIKYPGFEPTSSTEKEPPSCFTPVKYVLEKASTTCFKVWCRLKMISEAVMSSASLVPHRREWQDTDISFSQCHPVRGGGGHAYTNTSQDITQQLKSIFTFREEMLVTNVISSHLFITPLFH